MYYLWLVIGLALLGLLAFRAGRVWPDASRRGFEPVRRFGWALLGGIAPAQLRIPDSYLPPDHCTAYAPDHKRLGASGICWPDDRRAVLLRLLDPPVVARPLVERLDSGSERWLL